MFCYKYNDNFLFSFYEYDFTKVDVSELITADKVYFLGKLPLLKSRECFIVNSISELFSSEENIDLLNESNYQYDVIDFIKYKIAQRRLVYINTNYPNWSKLLKYNLSKKFRINVIGLGDVGGTLLIGLRLLGSDVVQSIGIYDRNKEKVDRWIYEINQIYSPFSDFEYPKVNSIDIDEIFDCDVFVFCVSAGVPELGEKGDVRMLQFEGNSNIIMQYAKMARQKKFKGIFAVVSDPVDLLCKVAYLESNKDNNNSYDFEGLSSSQIIGFGLGVMNARAIFYSNEIEGAENYSIEGRVFGPHGQGIIVANSIKNYDDNVSVRLTAKVKNANLDVRKTGYKPYIAPALSSGALSIISMLKGEWFYGSTFLAGVFFGCKIRYLEGFIEIEKSDIPPQLMERIRKSYNDLEVIL
ncbi:L-lactate dehydrogenase 2 [Caloramator mitchellensis]|uniref:L-lactate dehydrogenase 2 n=1 Tax=Caloramator mitchellensis TaxID=908809 RepID=A0A0R3JX01_CALMK|nr:lactate dehydrogenase [Caloramator mitchellensis]KRQ88075.1 L-lactate dehydrogenase 2 [Caloramator mitchellensis]